MVVVVNANTTPTFTQLGPYCVGDTPGTLPTTSTNGVAGTWDAAISTATAGSITYNFTPTSGCNTTATMVVIVNSNATPTFTQLGPYCVGDTPGTLLTTSNNGVTGTWDAAISTTSPDSTTYTFTPTSGCSAIASMVVVVNSIPFVLASSDVIIELGESTTLNATGTNGSYSWTPPTWLSCVTCIDPISTPEETITYAVTIVDSNGCTASDEVTVTVDYNIVIFVPNIFSPNGDGNNDVLYVRGVGVQTLNFFIYDRWGEKVFETETLDTGWDGTFRGKAMNNSVFVYYLQATFVDGSEVEQKGDITLIR
jgi:gliding motility-associated-like protein